MIRWGLLGASRILDRALLPAIRAAGHPVVALAARDPARAAERAAAWDIPDGCSYDALVARPDVDAVYISVVNDAHLPWTLRALLAGKHVLCEKPLALDAGQVRQVQAAEAASGRRAMEAFVYGFHPQIPHALAALRAGAIGRLVSVDAQFYGPLADWSDYRAQARHGGGALLDLGTYCVSLARAALGREPDRVAGFPIRRGDVDATFHGVLDFGDATAAIGCSFEGARGQSCRITGTAGTIDIDAPFSSKDRPLETQIAGIAHAWPPCDPYRSMVEHFAAAIAGETPLQHGTADALAQAVVLDKLRGEAP